jgi:hypothetical protein
VVAGDGWDKQTQNFLPCLSAEPRTDVDVSTIELKPYLTRGVVKVLPFIFSSHCVDFPLGRGDRVIDATMDVIASLWVCGCTVWMQSWGTCPTIRSQPCCSATAPRGTNCRECDAASTGCIIFLLSCNTLHMRLESCWAPNQSIPQCWRDCGCASGANSLLSSLATERRR